MKYTTIFLIMSLMLTIMLAKDDVIIDSKLTFEQAIKGTKAPKSLIDSLRLVDVQYYSFDGRLHQGQIVVNRAVMDDVVFVFNLIRENKFPIGKVIPIVKYDWSDDASMEDNNTSAFNYRFVAGTTRMSNHAFGKAVDINPFYNPVMYADGRISPKGAKYDTTRKGTFSVTNPVVKEFIKRGWRWGGNFASFKDNHHFDKQD